MDYYTDKNKETITIGVQRCNICGAPMYPNPAKQAFYCPFCNHERPYGKHLPRMRYQHRKLEISPEGYVNLKRVTVLSALKGDEKLLAERRWRTFDELVLLFDRRAFVTYKNRKEFSFSCPACGAEVNGNSTMSMFQCEYCGMKYSFEDAAEHGYIKIARIIGYEGMLPHQCLPYEVTPNQAAELVRRFVSRFSSELGVFPVKQLLQNGKLLAIYAPGRLWDRQFLLEVSIGGGVPSKFYVEWINWVSLCNSLDGETFDRLQPWSFEKAGPLVPEYIEGDVRLMATLNDNDELELRQALLKKRLTEEISEAYHVTSARITKWGYDFTKHKNGSIAMPVYYMEYRDKENQRYMNILVNGQTGKTAASVSINGEEHCFEWMPDPLVSMAGECSMHAKPVLVKYIKPNFFYETIPYEKYDIL